MDLGERGTGVLTMVKKITKKNLLKRYKHSSPHSSLLCGKVALNQLYLPLIRVLHIGGVNLLLWYKLNLYYYSTTF